MPLPKQKNIKEFILSELDNSDSSGVYVTRILSKGQKQGYHRKEIWAEVVSLFSDKGAQKRWSNWASLSDREEIRLRLKVLNETGTLDESLTDFILFFFRASDPVFYQLSSIVLGREMENNSRLNSYFVSYCTKRNMLCFISYPGPALLCSWVCFSD